jgi:WD40 repeat protein
MGCRNWVVSGPFKGHDTAVWSVSSPAGRQIVSAADCGTIYVWDVETGQMVGGPFGPFTVTILSVASSLDVKYIIIDLDDNFVTQVWNIATGKPANDVWSHQKVITFSIASPDGKRIVGHMNDHTVRVLYAKTHKLVSPPFEGHTDKTLSAAFSPDGRRIISGSSDQTIRVVVPRCLCVARGTQERTGTGWMTTRGERGLGGVRP